MTAGIQEGEAAGTVASLGRIGSLQVRFAHDEDEVREAQRLRYAVFFEEGSAKADPVALLTGLDADRVDPFCRHLVVIEGGGAAGSGKVVGACRLLTSEGARKAGGFYSESEFDLAPLLARHATRRFVELGRFCVAHPYRDRRTVELLWQGIWAFIRATGADVMIGCASLEGTDPDRLAPQLAFLANQARSPEAWCVRAHPHLSVAMERLDPAALDPRATLRALPTLVKGYLRLGATVGDGAVIDRQFGTTDVFVVLPVAAIGARYRGYFGA